MSIEQQLGVAMTYADVLAYLENPPPGAEQIFASKSAHKRMQGFAVRYEEALWNQMVGRVTQLHDRAVARVAQVDETLDEVEAALARWEKGLRANRIEPDEVLSNVREIPSVLKAVVIDLDASLDDAAAAEGFLEQSVEEFQLADLNRLPAMRNGLPVVSGAFLCGEAEDPRLPGQQS